MQTLYVSLYPRSVLISIVFWALTMLSLPVVGWMFGEGAFIRSMSFGVLMQAGAVIVILYAAWGRKRALKTILLLSAFTYLAELLGSQTGFPFGKYHYTDLLQPQLAGVPLLIPLAWLMMLPPAWGIAATILEGTNNLPAKQRTTFAAFLNTMPWGVRFSLLSALTLTAWDVFLDPQMVAWGFWVWETPGLYFGIPLSNYLGWFVTSFFITLFLNPNDLPLGPLSLIYILTWILQTIGQGVFWGQPGPAAMGFIACGLFVLLSMRRSQKGSPADNQ